MPLVEVQVFKDELTPEQRARSSSHRTSELEARKSL
jgi:hypothetical protein